MTTQEARSFCVKAALDKEVSQQKLTFQGQLPSWIKGTFVRNGPVPIQINQEKVPHWFDGPAMLHAFSFENGNLSYTNKFLKTDALNTIYTQGDFNYVGFATLPRHPMLQRIKEFFSSGKCPPIQNANVNVAKVRDKTLAYTETPRQVCFNINTLDTLGAVQFQDRLPKANVFESAHPHVDGKTGEQFNYIVDYGLNSHYIIYRYPAYSETNNSTSATTPIAIATNASTTSSSAKREVISKIPIKKPAYMHSFGVSEHYIILVEFPFIVNPIDIMFITKPFIKNYYWNPQQGTRFRIIRRDTGEEVACVTDPNPFFAFHHVNAYEENNTLIIDMVTYPNANVISNLSEHGYLSSSATGNSDEHLQQTKLMRYFISLQDNSLSSKTLFDNAFEFPRINEHYSAHPYRFVYGTDVRPLDNPQDIRRLYKIDTTTQAILSWQEPGVLPGEPIFIAHPNKKEEDDGVIVTIVFDPVHQTAFLLCLDAKSFEELGRAYTPFPIPVGLHGQFFGSEKT